MSLVKRKRKTPKAPKPPKLHRLEQGYAASILLLIEPFKQSVRETIYPLLPQLFDDFKTDAIDPEIIKNAFRAIRARYSKQVDDGRVRNVAKGQAARINKQQSQYHQRVMNVITGVNPIQLEPWLDNEVQTFMAENVSLIKSIPDEGLTDIEQMLYRDGSRKLSPQQMRKKIEEEFDVTEGRARVISRDQVSKFNGRLTEQRQVNLGITKYTWITSKDGRVRSSHERLDGKVFSWDEPPVTVSTGKRAGERNHPGGDIQCFPGESKVDVINDVGGATRHMFAGELSCIITSSNKLIESTPNHPVLTMRGWVAMKDIKIGDYVAEIVLENNFVGTMNNENMVSTIRDIFTSINKRGISQTIKGSHANFHGDIPKGDINAVFPARGLAVGGIADRINPVDDIYLSETNKPFSAISDFNQSILSYFSAFSCHVRFFNTAKSLFARHFRHTNNVGLRGVPYFYAMINKLLFNTLPGYAYSFVDREDAFPVQVISGNIFNINRNIVMRLKSFFMPDNKASCPNFFTKHIRGNGKLFSGRSKSAPRFYKFTRVSNISTRKYSGHVYNLSTVKGWYSVNGIIAHNCRCQAIPVLDNLI